MSDIKITAGLFKGFALSAPDNDKVRPTLVRARKALLDSLGSFEGKKVLDLCSGIGTLALEAASRGAESVVCIEKSSSHCGYIQNNFSECGYSKITVINSDIIKLDYSRFSSFDYIFADPPYAASGELFLKLVEKDNFKKICQDAVLIWELPSSLEDVLSFYKSESFRAGKIKVCCGTKFLII